MVHVASASSPSPATLGDIRLIVAGQSVAVAARECERKSCHKLLDWRHVTRPVDSIIIIVISVDSAAAAGQFPMKRIIKDFLVAS